MPSNGCVCTRQCSKQIVAVTPEGRSKSRPCGFPAGSADGGLCGGSRLAPCLGNRQGRAGMPGVAVRQGSEGSEEPREGRGPPSWDGCYLISLASGGASEVPAGCQACL